MKWPVLISTWISLFTGALSQNAPTAISVLTPINVSNVSGTVLFTWDALQQDTTIQVQLSGLNASQAYGFHIHNYGDISNSINGSTTYGHFNPFNKPHACPVPGSINNEMHVGDLGSLQSDAQGNVNVTLVSKLASLNATDLSNIIGRGIVLHSKADDCTTQPTGNSGSRISHGVIGWKSNPTAGTLAVEKIIPYQTLNGQAQVAAPIGAKAVFSPTNTSVQGYFDFTERPGMGLIVTGTVSGLEPLSTHGVHIHALGDISSMNGANTGGHFNPLNQTHGCFPNATRHSGDLGNIVADDQGVALVHLVFDAADTSRLSLDIRSRSCALGRAVIIHSKADDCKTDPTGNSGYRMAQGVIGYRNVTQVDITPTLPTGRPVPTDYTPPTISIVLLPTPSDSMYPTPSQPCPTPTSQPIRFTYPNLPVRKCFKRRQIRV